MRLLVIGMDGAHAGVFQRGWTPFTTSLLADGDVLELHEDLVSRGWSEVITGQHGSVTGAIYDRPNLDGSHGWSLRFKLGDIPGVGEFVKPVWQTLNERGFRVGVMNVPTAFPAPAVDGFFVSGGGGGGPVLQDALPELCQPRSVLSTLAETGYVVDERLGSLLAEKKLYDPNGFFGRLAHMNERRTDAFIRLSEEFEPDFGFLVYKSSSNLAEFLLLPDLDRGEDGRGTPDPELLAAVEAYYAHFDALIGRLAEAYPDTTLLFVSDHGMASRRWSVNPNALLQHLGYQVPSKANRGLFEAVRFVKKFIPYRLRLAIRGVARVKSRYESMTPFDQSESLAFSTIIGDWRHGIFINDKERFGGPVEPELTTGLAEELIDRINSLAVLQEHGIAAYRRPIPAGRGSPHFPDIVLRTPDGYMTSNDSTDILAEFVGPAAPLGIRAVTRGQLLCGKASAPIAVAVRDRWKSGIVTGEGDLTAVYNHILMTFPAAH